MEALRKAKLKPNYQVNTRDDLEISIFNTGYEQIPGYLAIKINRYNFNYDQIQFFGVNQKGNNICGKGVFPSHVSDGYEDEVILLFNISKLISNKQFTEETVEGVITLAGKELGRKKIKVNPSIYIG